MCHIGITIFLNDTDYTLDSWHQPNDYEDMSHVYEDYINVKHNKPVELYTIPLPDNVLQHSSTSQLPPGLIPLQVAPTYVCVDWKMSSPILHLLYPDMGPIIPGRVSGINSISGCRFGVPFLDSYGIMYGQPLSVNSHYTTPSPIIFFLIRVHGLI